MNYLSRYSRIALFVMRYRRAGVLRGVPGHRRHAEPADERLPQRLVDDLERLGPAFIKLGQALSCRPDLVREPFLAALTRIQDRVEPIDAEAVRMVVTRELGAPPEQVFRSFDPVPLAAGSLAQVHAVVLPDGTDAAIKVQRPGIAQRIRSDLDALERLAMTAQRHTEVGRRYGFVPWIAEMRRSLLNELDFVAEANHMDTFGHHLEGYRALYIPTPYFEFTTSRVLTMSRVRGHKLGAAPVPEDRQISHAQLGGQLLSAYVDQVFVHGLIHADPHPGNLVLMDDGRLCLLDFGMVTGLSPAMRNDLLRLMLAAADGDGDGVADICERLCVVLPELDRAAYRRAVCNAVLRYASASDQSRLEEGRLLLSLTRIGADNGLRPPAELSLLGRALLNLEPALERLSHDLPTRELMRRRLLEVVASQLVSPVSQAKGGSLLLEAQKFAINAPGQLGRFIETLAENRLRVRIDGLEESHLIENLQKIANRIAAGVITAALLIAGALIARVAPVGSGYGYVAATMFALAAIIGFGLVVNALRRDRSPPDDGEAGR
jgi:predicted unusual protein kinase regulating ubiquinone biosynthesis (AarF/ABC1/UbiB family)